MVYNFGLLESELHNEVPKIHNKKYNDGKGRSRLYYRTELNSEYSIDKWGYYRKSRIREGQWISDQQET